MDRLEKVINDPNGMPNPLPLEQALETKVKPLLDQAMVQYLGVKVEEIKTDISDHLKKSPLLDFLIDTRIPFKKAKDEFRRQYLLRMLLRFYGNISLVAKHASVDRRSIHRLIERYAIDVDKFREEMLKFSYVKEMAVSQVIHGVLDSYKGSLNPEKASGLYGSIDDLSKSIVKELPDAPLTMDQAEAEFEKKFIAHALSEHGSNISKTSRSIGIRFETLHRKMKELGVAR
ncbi:MAG TPA: helix-turn-helix domain-containing protein [Candidatus Nanoarchaeia archaeon]|nr:helix-turn-helix domain-containing protein [Candidatus Nanoarchaeia archaeon]